MTSNFDKFEEDFDSPWNQEVKVVNRKDLDDNIVGFTYKREKDKKKKGTVEDLFASVTADDGKEGS